MDSYVDLVMTYATQYGSFKPLLSLMFLFMARMLPIIMLAPFFGAKLSPHPMKMALALSFFAIFLPKLIMVTTTPLDLNLRLVFLMCKELFVGLAIGTMISVPFFIAQNAGVIIDHQRGGASLMVNDPTMQNQSSPFGTLFNFTLILTFFWMGGPFIFIDSIVSSYDVLPPDRIIGAHFFTENSSFWQNYFTLFNRMMVLSVQIASPGLVTILMTDFFLGIANRLAPQVQITFLGLPMKSLLAMGVIWLGWKFLNEQLAIEAHAYLREVNKIILSFAGN